MSKAIASMGSKVTSAADVMIDTRSLSLDNIL